MAKKRKPTADAVEILHRRYYDGKPDRLKALEEARAHDEVARKTYELRAKAGLTQRQLAKLVGTTASVICMLEDADYEGHSLSMLRRIAASLDTRVEIRFRPLRRVKRMAEAVGDTRGFVGRRRGRAWTLSERVLSGYNNDSISEAPPDASIPHRDHFRLPWSEQNPWEGFHSAWANSMVRYLNLTCLPRRYRAVPQVHLGQDVFEVRIHDENRGMRLVAVVELVSPWNKDRPENRHAFATKCAAHLQEQVNVVMVDVVTTRHASLHRELLTMIAPHSPRVSFISAVQKPWGRSWRQCGYGKFPSQL